VTAVTHRPNQAEGIAIPFLNNLQLLGSPTVVRIWDGKISKWDNPPQLIQTTSKNMIISILFGFN
jgi:hypothetical protein